MGMGRIQEMLVGYSQAEQAARRAECWKYLRLGTEPGPIPALGTQSLPGPPLAGKSQVDIAEFSDSLGMETTGEWRHSEPYERILIHET